MISKHFKAWIFQANCFNDINLKLTAASTLPQKPSTNGRMEVTQAHITSCNCCLCSRNDRTLGFTLELLGIHNEDRLLV